jgi:dihydrofolate reductase
MSSEPPIFSQERTEGLPPFEFVVAVALDDAIGRGNRLPWHLRADLLHFKALTTGKTILMGRKTYDAIGRALPRRRNLVLTRQKGWSAPDCTPIASVHAARDAAANEPVVMVIGGAEVYRLCLAHTRKIHLTLVHTRIDGADTFFDAWRGTQWSQTQREEHRADAQNDFDYSFITLERRFPA